MGKVIMVIEKSKDHFGAYSDNCEGIYAGGNSIEAVKADAMEAIRLLKKIFLKIVGQSKSKEI